MNLATVNKPVETRVDLNQIQSKLPKKRFLLVISRMGKERKKEKIQAPLECF